MKDDYTTNSLYLTYECETQNARVRLHAHSKLSSRMGPESLVRNCVRRFAPEWQGARARLYGCAWMRAKENPAAQAARDRDSVHSRSGIFTGSACEILERWALKNAVWTLRRPHGRKPRFPDRDGQCTGRTPRCSTYMQVGQHPGVKRLAVQRARFQPGFGSRGHVCTRQRHKHHTYRTQRGGVGKLCSWYIRETHFSIPNITIFSQPFKEKCISDVARIGGIILMTEAGDPSVGCLSRLKVRFTDSIQTSVSTVCWRGKWVPWKRQLLMCRAFALRQSEWWVSFWRRANARNASNCLFNGVHYLHQHRVDAPVCLPPHTIRIQEFGSIQINLSGIKYNNKNHIRCVTMPKALLSFTGA